MLLIEEVGVNTKHRIDLNPRTQGLVHPEQTNVREFFLGNFDRSFIARLKEYWVTLRVGQIAYDNRGAPFPEALLPRYRPLPVFVSRNEALIKHYALRTARRDPIPNDLLKKTGLHKAKKEDQ
jgi:hypothetical protein